MSAEDFAPLRAISEFGYPRINGDERELLSRLLREHATYRERLLAVAEYGALTEATDSAPALRHALSVTVPALCRGEVPARVPSTDKADER